MKCAYCQGPVSQNESQCPNCGAPINMQLNDTQKSSNIADNCTKEQENNSNKSKISPLNFSAGTYNKYKEDEEIFNTKKSRSIYILSALFLGVLGIHNFYAGYYWWAIIQLLLTATGAGFFVVVPWVLIEIFVIKKDAKGRPLE